MADVLELPLVDASVPDTVSLREAVSRLFDAQVPALAVLHSDGRLAGVLAEVDVLRAVFPRYLAELRHTAFLEDDLATLVARAREVRDRPVVEFARQVTPLDADESETHAAERFLHSGEQALPVVQGRRFLGMLSIAALCHARLGAVPDDQDQG
jgi:CBS domain-containing protein